MKKLYFRKVNIPFGMMYTKRLKGRHLCSRVAHHAWSIYKSYLIFDRSRISEAQYDSEWINIATGRDNGGTVLRY